MNLRHSDEQKSFLLDEWVPLPKNHLKIHRRISKKGSESEQSSGSSFSKDLSQLARPKVSQLDISLELLDYQTILS